MATDICKALNYSKPTMMTRPLDDCDKAKKFLGSGTPANIISRPGLIQVLMRAQRSNAKAKALQDWISREVLPSIRKTGSYVAPGAEKETAAPHAATSQGESIVAHHQHSLNCRRRRWHRGLLLCNQSKANPMEHDTCLRMAAELLKDLIPHRTKESVLLAKILLYIALNPGCSSRELALEFEIDQATVSRTTAILRHGRLGRLRKHPKKRGLICCVTPRTREYRYELTERGELMMFRVTRRMLRAFDRALASSAKAG
ncbi:BRO family protein [Roseobacteraceae bacterium NS-SX3]